ncbi:MAG TPA: hypothetical protein VFV38_21925 [Ktedonobacteraceae bacterium]|nr:hypothetical protein [Ktedonobacteraceae bacterium]
MYQRLTTGDQKGEQPALRQLNSTHPPDSIEHLNCEARPVAFVLKSLDHFWREAFQYYYGFLLTDFLFSG